MEDKELLAAIAGVKETVTSEIGEMKKGAATLESRIVKVEDVQRTGQKDPQEIRRALVLSALIAPLKGEKVEDVCRTMGTDFLRVEEVKQILPPLDIGTDLMTIFLTQPSRGISAKLATVVDTPLGTGSPSASAWSGSGPAVGLFKRHSYLSYDLHEAQMATVDAATEIGKCFFRRRNKTLKSAFVTGDGAVTLKGIEEYDVSHDWSSKTGKLFCEKIGASGTFTVAELRAGVQAAKNRLPEDSTPVVMMRGDSIALAENDTEDNVAYWKVLPDGTPTYCGCQAVRNDYLSAPDDGEDKIIAVVLAKGRGYGVAYNPELVVSADTSGDTKNLYTGQSLGGAIADNEAIVGIEVNHSGS